MRVRVRVRVAQRDAHHEVGRDEVAAAPHAEQHDASS